MQINQQIGKLILHQYASDVIEYIYSSTENENQRREMVQSFYGQYFLLLKALDDKDNKDVPKDYKGSLKQFCDQKPQLAEQVLHKIEEIVQKLVEKGMSRHSLVQAIILEYLV